MSNRALGTGERAMQRAESPPKLSLSRNESRATVCWEEDRESDILGFPSSLMGDWRGRWS